MSEIDMNNLGVACGRCGGEVVMNTCAEHHQVTSSDCKLCGLHYEVGPCPDCQPELLGMREKD